MATDVAQPRWVPRDDRATRKAAAQVARKAYRTHVLTLLSGGALSLFALSLVIETLLTRTPTEGLHPVAYYGILASLWPLASVFGFSVMPWLMYIQISRGERVAFVDAGLARAVAVSAPTRVGQQKIHSLAAWPKRHGAARVLGLWMLDEAHRSGDDVVAYALPGLVRTYERHGLRRVTPARSFGVARLESVRPQQSK